MRVVLGGIVRNIEPNILSTFKFLQSLKEEIPNLEVCLYENNSTDSTKERLEELNNLSFINILSENYIESFFVENFPARTYKNEGCRIHKIAFARNKLLKMISEKDLSSEDFVILMDLDIHQAPNTKLISELLTKWSNNIHILFANGVNGNGHYYDAYEVRTKEHPFGPEILGEHFWSHNHMANLQPKYDPNGPLIPVLSAFGGLAIYRADVIKECSYSADVTDELHELYSSLPIIDPNPQTHINGCSLGCYLKDSKIFYKNNSGYNYPVAAEHVNFHLQIRKKGFTNMFICPFLYYYWG